jgi:hypothetical protein
MQALQKQREKLRRKNAHGLTCNLHCCAGAPAQLREGQGFAKRISAFHLGTDFERDLGRNATSTRQRREFIRAAEPGAVRRRWH